MGLFLHRSGFIGGSGAGAGGGAGTTDPLWSSVQLLVQDSRADADETFFDISDDARTVQSRSTANNAALWDETYTKFGNNTIRCGSSISGLKVVEDGTASDLDFSGEFTIEAFIRFDSTNDNSLRDIFVKMGGSSSRTIRCYVNNKILNFYVSTDGTNISLRDTGFNTTSDDGTFVHVAICRDSSDDIRIFWNGSQKGADLNVSGALYTSSQPFYVTSNHLGSATPNANSNNIRFTAAARYTADFTPPTGEFPES